jgi:hypothetical protein
MDGSRSFTISVKYQLREYLSVVRAHARSLQHSTGAPLAKRILDDVIIATFGTAMYFYKTWRVGSCTFSVDDAGITRISKDGAITIPWAQVTSVIKYSSSFLIVLSDGAMPIPYRVLSIEQKAAIESWAGTSLVVRAAA